MESERGVMLPADPLLAAIDGVTREIRMIFYARPDLVTVPEAIAEMLDKIAHEQADAAAKMHDLMHRIAEAKKRAFQPAGADSGRG